MRKPVLLALGLLASGCAAQMVEARGESQYAPMNERSGGRIKYRSSGLMAASLREDAYKQMSERCGGRYVIAAEWDEVNGVVSAANAQGTSSASKVITNRLIDFECVSGEQASAGGE